MNHPPPRPHLRTSACLLLSSSIITPLRAMIVFLSLACHSHLREKAEKMLLSSSRYPQAPLSLPLLPCLHSRSQLSVTPPITPLFPSLTITPFFPLLHPELCYNEAKSAPVAVNATGSIYCIIVGLSSQLTYILKNII